MKKTNSVRTIWAARNGVIDSVRSHRLPRAPLGWQSASAFSNVRLVLVPEMFQRRHHRRHRGVAKCTERFPRDISRDAAQQIEIAHLTFAAFDAVQNLVQP